MKQYIKAELQIVRVNNNDIVTASVAIGNTIDSGTKIADAPGRRRSIWD